MGGYILSMTIWHMHFLNARNALTGVMAEIRATAREAVALTGEHIDLPRFDMVIRASDRPVPDGGILGSAPSPGVIELTLTPDRLSQDALRRIMVRQLFHLLRWDNPRRGESLGDVLVSEGLAGHFVMEVLGGSPDQWDTTRPGSGSLRQAANLWARRDFDHAEWFAGRGKMRKWTGYGLGHRLVAEHLAHAAEETASSLAWTPADVFRPALRRLMAIEGVEEPQIEAVEKATAKEPVASRDAGGQAPRPPQEP